jgi:hypothetical protein
MFITAAKLNCAKYKVISFTKKTEPLLFNYSISAGF